MIAILDRWIALSDRIARIATWIGGALLLAAAIVVSADVLLRKLFLFAIGGADELSSYAFAIGTTWALAFTLLRRANVRVDALYSHLARPLRAALDLMALLALIVFVGFLTYHAWSVLDTSLAFQARATTPLATPLWIPQSLWLAGLVLFLLTALPLTLRVALALMSGDLNTVRSYAGARTIEEDAADEISHTTTLRAQGGTEG